MSEYGYLEVLLEGPFDFEITRVDCTKSQSDLFCKKKCRKHGGVPIHTKCFVYDGLFFYKIRINLHQCTVFNSVRTHCTARQC